MESERVDWRRTESLFAALSHLNLCRRRRTLFSCSFQLSQLSGMSVCLHVTQQHNNELCTEVVSTPVIVLRSGMFFSRLPAEKQMNAGRAVWRPWQSGWIDWWDGDMLRFSDDFYCFFCVSHFWRPVDIVVGFGTEDETVHDARTHPTRFMAGSEYRDIVTEILR